MWLICFYAHSPKNSVAPGIFSHSPTPSITELGKPIECIQGRWHRFSHWADLVLSSSWKQATWPGESLLISLNIIFLCVPWGDVRVRLIRDNLSKMASMQEACNKWWLLMNVCGLTTWSIFLCISCPLSQLFLEQASVWRWTSSFFSLAD